MKKTLSFQEKYDAYGRRDSLYEGVFITAVKTTGIFCRPSCRAKKPKVENVIFYDTVEEALQNGFRPCKLCKPMEKMGETPAYIVNIIKELHESPSLRIKDDDLRTRGIEPTHIRRWFKRNYNITFHSYQRMLRINTASNHIKQGETITNSAFDSGYNSLSGFNESYRSIFGESVTRSGEKIILNLARFTTPIGPVFVCASNKGICLLEFADKEMLVAEFQSLCERLNAVILPGTNPHLEHVQIELAEYFSGERVAFTVPLHAPKSTTQESIWEVLNKFSQADSHFQHLPVVKVKKTPLLDCSELVVFLTSFENQIVEI